MPCGERAREPFCVHMPDGQHAVPQAHYQQVMRC